MRKIYFLSTCDTCKRIMKELGGMDDFEQQDIKTNPITAEQLEAIIEKVGTYEALFSRRARKYRALGLHEQTLTENDYKSYLLEEYTFLKRPVIIIDENVFIGNSKKTIAAAKAKLEA